MASFLLSLCLLTAFIKLGSAVKHQWDVDNEIDDDGLISVNTENLLSQVDMEKTGDQLVEEAMESDKVFIIQPQDDATQKTNQRKNVENRNLENPDTFDRRGQKKSLANKWFAPRGYHMSSHVWPGGLRCCVTPRFCFSSARLCELLNRYQPKESRWRRRRAVTRGQWGSSRQRAGRDDMKDGIWTSQLFESMMDDGRSSSNNNQNINEPALIKKDEADQIEQTVAKVKRSIADDVNGPTDVYIIPNRLVSRSSEMSEVERWRSLTDDTEMEGTMEITNLQGKGRLLLGQLMDLLKTPVLRSAPHSTRGKRQNGHCVGDIYCLLRVRCRHIDGESNSHLLSIRKRDTKHSPQSLDDEASRIHATRMSLKEEDLDDSNGWEDLPFNPEKTEVIETVTSQNILRKYPTFVPTTMLENDSLFSNEDQENVTEFFGERINAAKEMKKATKANRLQLKIKKRLVRDGTKVIIKRHCCLGDIFCLRSVDLCERHSFSYPKESVLY